MQYDKELIAHKLDRWDRFITDYHLPEWDAIPDLGLYMDQVVVRENETKAKLLEKINRPRTEEEKSHL